MIDKTKWRLLPVLWRTVGDLFPTRSHKRALWVLIGLSSATTVAELAAAQFFGDLIVGATTQSPVRSAVLLGLFLVSFGAIRWMGYFQSVYRLTVFDRSLRDSSAINQSAQSWQWPMAMELVNLLTQLSRLVMVAGIITVLSPLLGLLNLISVLAGLTIISRAGRLQYDVQMEFLKARYRGQPPTPSERVGARIRGAERAGLIAIFPVLLFVAAIGYAAVAGLVAVSQALVLFIAGRMTANMYGTMASGVVRFTRAQVNVDGTGARNGDEKAAEDQSGVEESSTVSSEDDADRIRDVLSSPDYAHLSAGQTFAKLLDEGQYLGSRRAIKAAMGDGSGEVPVDARGVPATTAYRVYATEPNQAWTYLVSELPVSESSLYLYLVMDVFSRAIVGWRIVELGSEDVIREVVAGAVQREEVVAEKLGLHSDHAGPLTACAFDDLFKELGVLRSLTKAASAGAGATRGSTVGLPALLADPSQVFPDAVAATDWMAQFVEWYNDIYFHAKVGYLHPADVHAGRARTIVDRRQSVLDDAFAAHPNRFPQGALVAAGPPFAAWITASEIETQSVDDASDSEAEKAERDLDGAEGFEAP